MENQAIKEKLFQDLLGQMGLISDDSEEIQTLADSFYENLDQALGLRLMQLLEDKIASEEELDSLTFEQIEQHLKEKGTSIDQIMTLEANQLALEIKGAVDYSRGYLEGAESQNEGDFE